MSGFRVFKTAEFDKDYFRLDKSDQRRVDKILGQLTRKGSRVGKPLGA